MRELQQQLQVAVAEAERAKAVAVQVQKEKELVEARTAQFQKEKELAEARAAQVQKEKELAEARTAQFQKEKELAEARAAQAIKESNKREFMSAMRGMCGSASEHSPVSSDAARRGAPEPVEVSVECFFEGLPEISASKVDAVWDKCLHLLRAVEPLPPAAVLEDLPERAFVHKVLLPLLEEMSRDTELRLWHEKPLADSLPVAEATPDVLWTHERDISASSLGAQLCGEVKRWGLDNLPLVRPPATAPCVIHLQQMTLFHYRYRRLHKQGATRGASCTATLERLTTAASLCMKCAPYLSRALVHMCGCSACARVRLRTPCLRMHAPVRWIAHLHCHY